MKKRSQFTKLLVVITVIMVFFVISGISLLSHNQASRASDTVENSSLDAQQSQPPVPIFQIAGVGGQTCEDQGKVTICHIPLGNPDNPQTICVDADAVPAHLAHGDYEGECRLPTPTPEPTATPIPE